MVTLRAVAQPSDYRLSHTLLAYWRGLLSRSYGAKGKGRVGRKQEWTGQRGSNCSNRGREEGSRACGQYPRKLAEPGSDGGAFQPGALRGPREPGGHDDTRAGGETGVREAYKGTPEGLPGDAGHRRRSPRGGLGAVGSQGTGTLRQGPVSAIVSHVLRRVPHRQEPGYPQPPVLRDRCALQRPRRQQVEPRGRATLPSVVAFAALSDPDLRVGARGAGDSASSAGIRQRVLRARPGRGDVEVRRELRGQSIRRERNRSHSAVSDRSSGRVDRGRRPADLSVRLET